MGRLARFKMCTVIPTTITMAFSTLSLVLMASTSTVRLPLIPSSSLAAHHSPHCCVQISCKSFDDQLIPRKANATSFTMENNQIQNKPRILCLHGYRTSASILQKMVGRWPQSLLQRLHLEFLDAPFPARGKSGVEAFYDPPYYEWYHANQDYTEYVKFDECMAYIEEYMMSRGPFDGLLGFSQGAFIAAAAPGMQAQGMALTRVPKIKFLILISAAKLQGYALGHPKLAANAFSSPINCPSLHLIGEKDFMKQRGTALLESFIDPVVIHHRMGHVIPRLDDKGLQTALDFIDKIQRIPPQAERLCTL